jgi:hypothetical protein
MISSNRLYEAGIDILENESNENNDHVIQLLEKYSKQKKKPTRVNSSAFEFQLDNSIKKSSL